MNFNNLISLEYVLITIEKGNWWAGLGEGIQSEQIIVNYLIFLL